jgi:hypothetical protein
MVFSLSQTVQMQQRAERDAAIARLEQSRIVLAMRLADHHGKKHKVIEEALAFVGDIRDAGQFVSPENLYGPPYSPSGEKFVTREGKRSNILIKAFISSFDFAKKSLKLDHMGGILGNAALVAVSMLAWLHLHQVAYREHPQKREDNLDSNRNMRQTSLLEESSSNGRLSQLDVLAGRGWGEKLNSTTVGQMMWGLDVMIQKTFDFLFLSHFAWKLKRVCQTSN